MSETLSKVPVNGSAETQPSTNLSEAPPQLFFISKVPINGSAQTQLSMNLSEALLKSIKSTNQRICADATLNESVRSALLNGLMYRIRGIYYTKKKKKSPVWQTGRCRDAYPPIPPRSHRDFAGCGAVHLPRSSPARSSLPREPPANTSPQQSVFF